MAIIILLISSVLVTFSNLTSKTAIAQTSTTTATSIPPDMLNYTWNNIRSTPEGTYASAGPGPTSASIAWKTPIPSAGGVMVAFNGLIFTSSVFFRTTYAVNAATGQIVWKAGVSGTSISKIDDTYMLVGGTCVFINNGSKVWTGPAGFGVGSQFNGIGYIPSIHMYLSGLSGWKIVDPAQPPTLVWDISSWIENSGGSGAQAGGVYGDGMLFMGGSFNQNDGFLYALNATTGTLIWKTPVTSTFLYGMTFDNGMIFHGGLDNKMHAWNATTGQLVWTYNPGTIGGQWASSTAAAYGIIYEHNQDTYLYAINETNGQLIWKQKGPGIGYSGIVGVAGGYIYSAMGDTQYRDPNTGQFGTDEYDCFNAYTGQLVWTMPMENGAPYNNQVLAYGNLYIEPTVSRAVPGGFYYSIYGLGSIGELWCISSTPAGWTMFGADSTHTFSGSGPSGNLTKQWSFNTGAEVISPVTIADGTAFVGSTNGKIYALNSTTGDKIWNFTTGYMVRSEVAVSNGKVYTGADDGSIYCLNAATGTKVWQTPAGGITISQVGAGIFPPARSSPQVVNGKVYVGSLDGNIYCLDGSSGAVKWKFQTGGPIEATPAIDNTGVYIYGSNPGSNFTLYKLDPNNGSIMWQNNLPYLHQLSYLAYGGVDASPTVVSQIGMVIVRSMFVKTWAINSTNGMILWVYNGTQPSSNMYQSGGVPQVCAPLYAYGLVYINDYYSITAINAYNGSKVWSTYLSREDLSQGLTYSYGRVYSVNELGTLYELDALTGEKVSYYELGSGLHSMPTLYNGSLYMGSNDWNVYSFGDAAIINAKPANVQPARADITIELRPANIIKGQAVIVAGNINGVHNAVPISVYFAKTDNSIPICINGITDANGGFTIIYTPDMVCSWTVVASWPGDATYLAGSSQSQTLTVTEPQQTTAPAARADIDAALATLLPLIIGSIVAVSVAIGIGAYTIVAVKRLRK